MLNLLCRRSSTDPPPDLPTSNYLNKLNDMNQREPIKPTPNATPRKKQKKTSRNKKQLRKTLKARRKKQRAKRNQRQRYRTALTTQQCAFSSRASIQAPAIDSGYSGWFLNSLTYFASPAPMTTIDIQGASGKMMRSNYGGLAKIALFDSKHQTGILRLPLARYVKDLTRPLIGVAPFNDMGYTVTFGNQQCIITDETGKTVAVAPRDGNLYVLPTAPTGSQAWIVDTVDDSKGKMSLGELWHRRLGCTNDASLTRMRDGAATGIHETARFKNDSCEVCRLTKSKKLPFSIRSTGELGQQP